MTALKRKSNMLNDPNNKIKREKKNLQNKMLQTNLNLLIILPITNYKNQPGTKNKRNAKTKSTFLSEEHNQILVFAKTERH